MIVREQRDHFLLVEQHEHAVVSGVFARHWAGEIRPRDAVLHAVANHDVGWKELDAEVRWNPATGRPYSFTDYPPEPKFRAYTRGLDLVEGQNPYAGYLCSRHYGSFVRDAREPVAVAFREQEERRRAQIEPGLSAEERAHAEHNFRLLQLCDDLSLFVCLNEPGENSYPWYRDGFRFGDGRLMPVWQDRRTLRLEPNPFSKGFDLTIPYRLLDGDGTPAGGDVLELRVEA